MMQESVIDQDILQKGKPQEALKYILYIYITPHKSPIW
ncbi:hypothetical protein NIES3974_16060 [Calothrix sp. NIES-3974]|nr:hypothetical protein NIES3974_16060 [Calothrix sp. NIES-3974]